MIKLIIALGPNNLIGNKDKMAWHIPEEFEHFKETTMDHWLLMGQTTYKGLPAKLPGRKMCVIGPEDLGEDHHVYNEKDLLLFLDKFKNSDEHIFIAGGKSVYESFYKLADELIVSEIKIKVPEGDVFLNWDLSEYKKHLIKDKEKFKVYKYTKEKI